MRARTDCPRVASLDLDLSEHLPIGGAPNAHGILDTNREILSVGTELGSPSIRHQGSKFRRGAGAEVHYGSCTSVVSGAIFNLQRALNVPQDEDITEPEGIFHGMATPSRQARKGVPL